MDEAAMVKMLRAVDTQLGLGTSSVAECRAVLAAARQREPVQQSFEVRVQGAGEVVFVTLCARYGLRPYRRSRRSRAVWFDAPPSFAEGVFQPQLQALSDALEREFALVACRVLEAWAGVSLASVAADISP
jgi:hypothetical protein